MTTNITTSNISPEAIANLLMATPRDTLDRPYVRGEIRSPLSIHTSYISRDATLDENRLVAGFTLEDLAGNPNHAHYLRTYQPDLYLAAQSVLEKHHAQAGVYPDLHLASDTAKNLGVYGDGKLLSGDQLVDAKVNLVEAMQAATEKATGKVYLLNTKDFGVHVSGGLDGNVDVDNLKSILVDHSPVTRFALEPGLGTSVIFRPTTELVEFDVRGARLSLSLDDIVQATVDKFQQRVPEAKFNNMLQSVRDAEQAGVVNAWAPESLEMHAQQNIPVLVGDVSLHGERSALDHITGKTPEELAQSRHPLIEGLREVDARNIPVQRQPAAVTQFLPKNEMPDILDARAFSDASTAKKFNTQINLTPYSIPISDADINRTASMANHHATNSTTTRISSQQPNLTPYSTPISEVELARTSSANSSSKGTVGVVVGAGLALASGAANAYGTHGDAKDKSNAFMKAAGNTLTDIAPVIGSVKAQSEGKPNEAIARFVDWTPVGEFNRYAQRLTSFVTGRPTDVAPGIVETFGLTSMAAIKNVAVIANEKLNEAQKSMGLPAPMTPKEEFVKAASYIKETGDTNVNIPEYKSVELKATVQSFAQLYQRMSEKGGISPDDSRALDKTIQILSEGFGTNKLQGVVANYEAYQSNLLNQQTQANRDMALMQ